jgi:hypothetical protein
VTQKIPKWFLWVWALVAAPALNAAFAWFCYWHMSLEKELKPPFDLFPARLYPLVFFLLLISGLAAILNLLKPKIWIRLIVGIIYFFIMGAFMFFLGAAIGCSWGDCI